MNLYFLKNVLIILVGVILALVTYNMWPVNLSGLIIMAALYLIGLVLWFLDYWGTSCVAIVAALIVFCTL